MIVNSERSPSRWTSRRVLLFLIVLTCANAADGQFWSREAGSELSLTVNHEPTVKIPLEHVAFSQPQGPCSEPLSDALVADFASSGAIVIDRLHLKTMMTEHKLNLSGAVDSKTAAKLGKLIGAGSLVFLKVHDCKTEHTKEPTNSVDVKGTVNRDLVPTTRTSLKASLQIVNLSTGVTLAARLIDAKAAVHSGDKASMKDKVLKVVASLQSRNDDDNPYPPDDEAVSAVLAQAVNQIHRGLFPWSETKKIRFFDDRECSLNTAYKLLRGNDYAGAAREADASLETCRKSTSIKPEILARAHYNRGMIAFLRQDYEGALPDLAQAARLDANKVFGEAMQECNRAWSVSQTGGSGVRKTPVVAEKPAVTGPTVAKPTATVEERLQKLDELYKKKMISEEEYQRKRKEILADI